MWSAAVAALHKSVNHGEEEEKKNSSCCERVAGLIGFDRKKCPAL